jgi:hypothetical protein
MGVILELLSPLHKKYNVEMGIDHYQEETQNYTKGVFQVIQVSLNLLVVASTTLIPCLTS